METSNKYYKYKNKIKSNNKEIEKLQQDIKYYELLDSIKRLKKSFQIFIVLFFITTLLTFIYYKFTNNTNVLNYILRYLNPIWLFLSIFIIEPFFNKKKIKKNILNKEMFYISINELQFKYIDLNTKIEQLKNLNTVYNKIIDYYDNQYKKFPFNNEKNIKINKKQIKQDIKNNISFLEKCSMKTVVYRYFKKIFRSQYINIFYSILIGIVIFFYWNYVEFIIGDFKLELFKNILIPFSIGFILAIIYFYINNRFQLKIFNIINEIYNNNDPLFKNDISIEEQVNLNTIDIKNIQDLLINDIIKNEINNK